MTIEALLGQIPTGDTALKRRHEGSEMTTNDKLITRNYDSDKEESEIDSDNRVLKLRQRLAAHSGRRDSILQ